MPKSTEQEMLEELVVAAGLDWLKAQHEELLTTHIINKAVDDPSTDLITRYELHSQSKYTSHLVADAGLKLAQNLTRLAHHLEQASKKAKP